MDIPTYHETEEKLECYARTDRTIIQAMATGCELNPLEKFINENEPHGDKPCRTFREGLMEALKWVVDMERGGK